MEQCPLDAAFFFAPVKKKEKKPSGQRPGRTPKPDRLVSSIGKFNSISG